MFEKWREDRRKTGKILFPDRRWILVKAPDSESGNNSTKAPPAPKETNTAFTVTEGASSSTFSPDRNGDPKMLVFSWVDTDKLGTQKFYKKPIFVNMVKLMHSLDSKRVVRADNLFEYVKTPAVAAPDINRKHDSDNSGDEQNSGERNSDTASDNADPVSDNAYTVSESNANVSDNASDYNSDSLLAAASENEVSCNYNRGKRDCRMPLQASDLQLFVEDSFASSKKYFCNFFKNESGTLDTTRDFSFGCDSLEEMEEETSDSCGLRTAIDLSRLKFSGEETVIVRGEECLIPGEKCLIPAEESLPPGEEPGHSEKEEYYAAQDAAQDAAEKGSTHTESGVASLTKSTVSVAGACCYLWNPWEKLQNEIRQCKSDPVSFREIMFAPTLTMLESLSGLVFHSVQDANNTPMIPPTDIVTSIPPPIAPFKKASAPRDNDSPALTRSSPMKFVLRKRSQRRDQ